MQIIRHDSIVNSFFTYYCQRLANYFPLTILIKNPKEVTPSRISRKGKFLLFEVFLKNRRRLFASRVDIKISLLCRRVYFISSGFLQKFVERNRRLRHTAARRSIGQHPVVSESLTRLLLLTPRFSIVRGSSRN